MKVYPAKTARMHDLKTWPQFFDHVWDGRKRFEVRENDRGYKVGDFIRLREYVIDEKRYTGREVIAEITYMFTPPIQKMFHVPDNVAVFSFKILSRRKRPVEPEPDEVFGADGP